MGEIKNDIIIGRRHRWAKKVNHKFCHEYYCKNGCGTVKDSSAMTNTFYWQDGVKRFSAGECIQQQNKK